MVLDAKHKEKFDAIYGVNYNRWYVGERKKFIQTHAPEWHENLTGCFVHYLKEELERDGIVYHAYRKCDPKRTTIECKKCLEYDDAMYEAVEIAPDHNPDPDFVYLHESKFCEALDSFIDHWKKEHRGC